MKILRPGHNGSGRNIMITLFIRSAILYIALVFTLRAMGKRQLGQFQPYELVVTLFIANLSSTPMADLDTPLWEGLLPPMALLIIHGAVTLISLRSDRVRALLSGRPTAIVSGGVFDEKEMRKLCLSLADALEGIRACGILDPAEVGSAVMEANGSISAFPRSSCRPVNAGEAGVNLPPEDLPMALVMDGRVQPRNLQTLGQSQKWLCAQLAGKGLAPRDVFLCSVDNRGKMTVQDRKGTMLQWQTEAAGWAG